MMSLRRKLIASFVCALFSINGAFAQTQESKENSRVDQAPLAEQAEAAIEGAGAVDERKAQEAAEQAPRSEHNAGITPVGPLREPVREFILDAALPMEGWEQARKMVVEAIPSNASREQATAIERAVIEGAPGRNGAVALKFSDGPWKCIVLRWNDFDQKAAEHGEASYALASRFAGGGRLKDVALLMQANHESFHCGSADLPGSGANTEPTIEDWKEEAAADVYSILVGLAQAASKKDRYDLIKVGRALAKSRQMDMERGDYQHSSTKAIEKALDLRREEYKDLSDEKLRELAVGIAKKTAPTEQKWAEMEAAK